MAGKWVRTIRHLGVPPWRLRRILPPESLAAIAQAVRDGERGHSGEIRFAVEAALDGRRLWRGVTARERAVEVFSDLRVWDTEENNGVLIYLLLADRDVEIVADRGAARRVPQADWERICRAMEEAFRRGEFEAGIIAGIRAVADRLAFHYGGPDRRGDELPDQPAVLGS
jgi:uncharacterized membrane protein